MQAGNFDALELLTTAVWLLSPASDDILFANQSARQIMGDFSTLERLRTGPFSALAQETLAMYVPDIQNGQEVIEIWTVGSHEDARPLSCRLTLKSWPGIGPVIVSESQDFAGQPLAIPPAIISHPSLRNELSFYRRFFFTNTAPMLLIDPAQEGLIVEANLAATRFYGYTRQQMRQRHTWEINALGRNVLPVMEAVARLPGGHKPLNFIHILADGSTRHVQTYAGPVKINGVRMMLCVIHDITEQKRLEQALENAALRDSLTGLWNRRKFYQLFEGRRAAHSDMFQPVFSLLLIDIDHFKRVNDDFGHQKGDEALVSVARTLESCVSENALVFRWGGEEFAVLMPQTPLQSAIQSAEHIRLAVANLVDTVATGITVSIGVAQYQSGEGLDSLFRRVDDALYKAKSSGRNNVLAA